MRGRGVFLVVLVVLALDQILKIWVKTHMSLGDQIPIFGDWFILHFTENKGMAFGLEFGGDLGKIFLTCFRIFAVAGIIYFIRDFIKQKVHWGFIFAMSLILAGAIGNIIDSIFYGWMFDHSRNQLATFFPEGGGYAKLMHGHVVDMLYFPLWRGYLPEWIPVWGGKYSEFFRPIFNIADSAITIGVFIILIFHRLFFKTENSVEA